MRRNGDNKFIWIIIIVGVIIYAMYSNYRFKKNGTIVVCKAVRFYKPSKGSVRYIEIYLHDTIYRNCADAFCPECVGKFYFAEVINDNPTGPVRFFDNSTVPPCILEKKFPYEGWKSIPKCD